MRDRIEIACGITIFLICVWLDYSGLLRPSVYPVQCRGRIGSNMLWNYSCWNTSIVERVEWTLDLHSPHLLRPHVHTMRLDSNIPLRNDWNGMWTW